MKIRSKLSGVVWAFVGITLCLSALFVWGAVRGQYYLQRAQFANHRRHSLLTLSRSVDQFFSNVYQSLARPDRARVDRLCDASESVYDGLDLLLENVEAEIDFVKAWEGVDSAGRESDSRARLLSLRHFWSDLEQDLLSEVHMAQERSSSGQIDDWEHVFGMTGRFSERIDESIRDTYHRPDTGMARLDRLFGELTLIGLVVWLTCSLIVGVAGFMLGRRIVAPIARLSRASRALGEGKITPVDIGGDDELTELADAFNTMAAQVESQQLVLLCAKGSVEAKNAALESEAAARREALRELEQAKNSAETANHAKSDFLARMSHEIRTPMNGITGMADVLYDADLGDELGECVRTIRTSAQALLEIVNDVLDFSKIEAGEMQLEMLPFDLKKLSDDVVHLLTPRAREKQLEVKLHYPADAPTAFVGDPGRVRQVLINLLGNAIKFTHEGRIDIRVASQAEPDEKARVTMSVEDSGIGVAAKDLGRIFEEFGQANVSTTREYGGTGLGLSISKGLVKLMGGEIGVESKPGVGSRFWFRVPLQVERRSAGDRDASSDETTPLGTGYGKRILVVDDNAVNRLVARRLLQRLDCTIVEASSGPESVQRVRDESFDMVLMDCRMPGMDGFEATAAIRAFEEERERRTPVIAVTANALEGDRERCLQAGMDDYVAKPIGISDLRRVLERWVADPSRVAETAVSSEPTR